LIKDWVNALATGLHQMHVTKGSSIVSAAGDDSVSVVTMLAAARLGVSVLPVAPTLSAEAIEYVERERHRESVCVCVCAHARKDSI
jgi:acyl-coenzyme A synthetase/AMP-(fatty) acid ligase